MKVVLGGLAAVVLGFVAATIGIAARVREEPVVSNPYGEGLRLGQGERRVPAAEACDLGATPCARALPGGGEVRIELGPRPLRTMKPLAVRVDLGAPAPEGTSVSVSFSMREMTMGENRSRLARTGPGRFEGTAVLVRCPSGRRDWVADVEVASPGVPERRARFSLAVVE